MHVVSPFVPCACSTANIPRFIAKLRLDNMARAGKVNSFDDKV